jgi:glycosyltransferase involved in cell wall biosynthesis
LPAIDRFFARFDEQRQRMERLPSQPFSKALAYAAERRRIRNLIYRAKATVCATLLDPVGLMLRSMRCGTPIVATKDGEFRETVLPSEAGFHVKRNTTAVALGTEQALADEEVLKKWSDNGKELMKNPFSLQACSANLAKQIPSLRATGTIDYSV